MFSADHTVESAHRVCHREYWGPDQHARFRQCPKNLSSAIPSGPVVSNAAVHCGGSVTLASSLIGGGPDTGGSCFHTLSRTISLTVLKKSCHYIGTCYGAASHHCRQDHRNGPFPCHGCVNHSGIRCLHDAHNTTLYNALSRKHFSKYTSMRYFELLNCACTLSCKCLGCSPN